MIGKQIAQQLAGAVEAEFDSFFTRVLHAGDLGVAHVVPGGEDENLAHVLRELRYGFLQGGDAFVGDGLLVGWSIFRDDR